MGPLFPSRKRRELKVRGYCDLFTSLSSVYILEWELRCTEQSGFQACLGLLRCVLGQDTSNTLKRSTQGNPGTRISSKGSLVVVFWLGVGRGEVENTLSRLCTLPPCYMDHTFLPYSPSLNFHPIDLKISYNAFVTFQAKFKREEKQHRSLVEKALRKRLVFIML